MKKSKLIELLATFDKRELRQFKDFISSPYYNKKQELIPFFNYLKKQAPDFLEAKIDRQLVYRVLYPDQAFNEKHIGYLMSYLTKLAEQFIGIQQYEKDDIYTDYHLLSALIERNLFKYYRQEYKNLTAKLSQKKLKSSTFFLKKYLVSEVSYRYFLSQHQRKDNETLQITSNSLDLFYITTKLQYSCEMVNRNKLLGAEYDVNLLEILNNALNHPLINNEPLAAIYNQIFILLSTEVTIENFQKLRSLIKLHVHKLSLAEKKKIYQYSINMGTQMMRKGEHSFFKECFDIYLDGIEDKIFFEEGFLSPWAYTNVIKLAINLKKYEWIEVFIHEHNPMLPEKFRENALHYNLADLYYHTNNFEKAIMHLHQLKASDVFLHIGSREILAKIYYETDEEEALLSLIASFSIFLRRNKKISPNIKTTYLNFCNLLNQLMRKNPKKILAIKEEIKNTSLLSARSWLLKVCNDIIKKLKIIA